MQNLELPDLGRGAELVPLLTMDVYFHEQYLSSQEPRPHYSTIEDDSRDSDHDNTKGEGLEEILWPPEILQQAPSYGKKKKGSQLESNH